MKRILALLLVLCMCVPFVACGPSSSTDGPVDSGAHQFIDNVGEHDFGGGEFVISALAAYEQEIYKEELEPDVFDNAVKVRNQLLEDRFHVNIVPVIYREGIADTYSSKICMDLMSTNIDRLDMILMQLWLAGPVVLTGFLYDLRSEVPYVRDVIGQVDYWSANTNDCYSIYNRQYVGVSDINTSAISATWCVLFDQDRDIDYSVAKKINASYNTLYDAVDMGTWTIDAMTAIVKDFWIDNPNSGTPQIRDLNDTYGMMVSSVHSREIFTSAFGYDLVINDGQTTPQLMTMTNNMVINIGKIKTLYQSAGFNSFTIAAGAETTKLFANKASLLYLCTLGTLDSDTIHESDIKFGVLPYPKADANQKAYYSGTNDSMSTVLAPVNQFTPLEMAGAMIEAMAAESHNSCLPAYYDVILKYNSTRDKNSVRMIEKIYEGRRYNFAGIHSSSANELNTPSGGGLAYMFRTLANPDKNENPADFWEVNSKNYADRLKELIQSYATMMSV